MPGNLLLGCPRLDCIQHPDIQQAVFCIAHGLASTTLAPLADRGCGLGRDYMQVSLILIHMLSYDTWLPVKQGSYVHQL